MFAKFTNDTSLVPDELPVTIEATNYAMDILNEAQVKIADIPFPWVESVEEESAHGSETGDAKINTGYGASFYHDEGNTVDISLVTEDTDMSNADQGLKRKSENIVSKDVDQKRSLSDGKDASTATGDPPGGGGGPQ